MTKAELLKLARKHYGAKVTLFDNPKAATADERNDASDRIREIVAREAELRALPKTDTASALIAAARFAIDVDGDEPSWTQLREALEAAENAQAVADELKALYAERKQLSPLTLSYRYRLGKDCGIFNHIEAQADTLEQLARMIPQ